MVWMGLIFIGSTDVLSAEHTSRFLVPFLRWINPEISLVALIKIQLAIRKLGHLTEYAILAMLLWRALRGGGLLATRALVLFMATLMACAFFAMSDEFHQSFVPSRTSSSRDVMIDIGGALIGLLMCWIFMGKVPRPARAKCEIANRK